MDSFWILLGYIPFGYLLDTVWITFAYILDTVWISLDAVRIAFGHVFRLDGFWIRSFWIPLG